METDEEIEDLPEGLAWIGIQEGIISVWACHEDPEVDIPLQAEAFIKTFKFEDGREECHLYIYGSFHTAYYVGMIEEFFE